jgi:hypothetical protein
MKRGSRILTASPGEFAQNIFGESIEQSHDNILGKKMPSRAGEGPWQHFKM